jgi:hypothetical protein
MKCYKIVPKMFVHIQPFSHLHDSCYKIEETVDPSTETCTDKVQGDSKLLSGFPWPIIFKPEIKNKTSYGI